MMVIGCRFTCILSRQGGRIQTPCYHKLKRSEFSMVDFIWWHVTIRAALDPFSFHPNMANEDFNEANRGTISIPFDEGSNDVPTRSPPRLVSLWSAIMILLLLTRIVYGIVASKSKSFSLLCTFVAVIATLIFTWWGLRSFNDGSFPNSFILSQYLVGAIPLFIISIVLKALFFLIAGIPAMLMLSKDFWKELKEYIRGGASNPEKAQHLLHDLIDEIENLPLWVVVVTVILLLFLTGATVEEIGKWLFSRRYKRPLQEATDLGRHVGARPILLSTAMVSIGFASMENLGRVNRLGSVASRLPFYMLILLLLQRLMSFPLHFGTQLHVAVAAAHRHVFRDTNKVGFALFQAILFRATFDSLGFIVTAISMLGTSRPWIFVLLLVLELLLFAMLMLLVRSRYMGLLERERVTLPEPV